MMSDKSENTTMMFTYDCVSGRFSYFSSMENMGYCWDERPIWQIFAEDGSASRDEVNQVQESILQIAACEEPQAEFLEVSLKHSVSGWNRYRMGISCAVPGTKIAITMTDMVKEESARSIKHSYADYDDLTKLLTKQALCDRVETILNNDPEGMANGSYALVYMDIHRFRVINDLFGREDGDRLLAFIGDTIIKYRDERGFACRTVSDHYVVFMPTEDYGPEILVENIQKELKDVFIRYRLSFEVVLHAGIYVTTKDKLTANEMMDRAAMAQSSIKGKYNERYAFYDESMRSSLIGEQEMIASMANALSDHQFKVYYQPQYNHSTGMLIGAEALIRWQHPERGLIPPVRFIEIFEKNGFITNLDLFVFEEVCRFLRKCIDEHWTLVPISTNFSRYDIFTPDFVGKLEAIRRKYEIPTKYLRLELTESAIAGNVIDINKIIKDLHDAGYIIEMDDFGSGFSSLNVLKDIDLDIIKLDLRFLEGSAENNNKGGTILSSIVRMAKWLNIPVIAEGVETVKQADFLLSIGCNYVQGYLYSKPLPEEEYCKTVSGSKVGAMVPQMRLIETMNSVDFWDPKSQETLIFSNYVGGAAIFCYHDDMVEVLRVNKKYLQKLGMNVSEQEIIRKDPLNEMDDENKKIYVETMKRAIATMDEQECETWRDIFSSCCGDERLCIRSTMRLIGVSGNQYLFYVMIRNVTTERLYLEAMKANEKQFKLVSEQVKVYFWEYTMATKEMRPCFRCMRDLELPPLVTNYPQSAFDAGIFPPEVYDMYFDWMRQLDEGVPELEAIIPLTLDRIPFRVRYTTEFDENGRPVKAYGSAALIVE